MGSNVKEREYSMQFEPMTIEHLGLRLYSTLPPVLGELVSNAYDAESPKVEVIIPTGDITPTAEVIVRDYGHGMSPDEVQNEYLMIGRCRRGTDSKLNKSKNGKVMVTGRKGIGKLSAFGVAREMEVRAIKGSDAVCLRLKFDAMQDWAKHHREPYKPEVVAERTGKTSDPDGVEVTLRGLKRKTPIEPDDIRKGLAKRLGFIGAGFQVLVNGTPTQPGDRLQKTDCPATFFWDVKDLPGSGKVDFDGKQVDVAGWIGFLDKSSQSNRGVDIFATGKAVELGSFFNFASTHVQFARAHLVGELHANFLDGPDDLISTARNSVVWESTAGQALQAWGQAALKWTFDKWLDLRRKKKEDDIITTAGFDRWLVTRTLTEQKVAKRMVSILVDDHALESSSAIPLLEIVKTSVETVAFRDLVETIETEGAIPKTILKLFDEWRIIEAREHLKLADGRMAALDRLNKFIDGGALEVKEMQPLLEKNLWILDPAWTEALVQATYTKLLREKCQEPKALDEKERRLDILGVGQSKITTIVEIKRPEKTLSREDLEQIERYVDWADANIVGTGDDAPTYIRGLLIVGKMSYKTDIRKKVERLAGDDIRVETYRDLYERSSKFYTEVERILANVAPEYKRVRKNKGDGK